MAAGGAVFGAYKYLQNQPNIQESIKMMLPGDCEDILPEVYYWDGSVYWQWESCWEGPIDIFAENNYDWYGGVERSDCAEHCSYDERCKSF